MTPTLSGAMAASADAGDRLLIAAVNVAADCRGFVTAEDVAATLQSLPADPLAAFAAGYDAAWRIRGRRARGLLATFGGP